MSTIEIDGRTIGDGESPYFIAEISANHNGSLERAVEIMEGAALAGADAVKLQTYTADSLTIKCDTEDFKISGGLWDDRTLYDLYQEASTPWDWHEPLFAKARELGVTVFSSAFDQRSADLLNELGAPAIKIASFELVDLPLISYVAGMGKPLILSTGLASVAEIEEAVVAARQAGCEQLALLYCISGYPTPLAQANLRTIEDMSHRFSVPVGLSDHTMGTTAATVAVALGASIVEKHITLKREDGGPDAEFSLEVGELPGMVVALRDAQASLGHVDHGIKPSEAPNLRFRRSLYAVRDIEAGERLTEENIRSIRPGFGLPPKFYEQLLGQPIRHSIAAGTPLKWEYFDKMDASGEKK